MKTTTEEVFAYVGNGAIEQLLEALTNDPRLARRTNEQGVSLLQFSAYCRNEEAIFLLHPLVEELSIYEATSIGDLPALKTQLIAAPEHADQHGADGFTPLGLACFFGHTVCVSTLLSAGADPNVASGNGMNIAPLHSACAVGHTDIARLLLAAGAKVNAVQQRGVTPLHSAAHMGNVPLVKLLLAAGADPTAKMEDGKTPLEMAEEGGFIGVIALLER